MAVTKYEVLCRYYNLDMKMPITNVVNQTWVSAFDTAPANANKDNYAVETFKYCLNQSATQEKEVQDLLIYGNNYDNPKFNMFFVYRSREFKYSNGGSSNYPYVLKDRMERMPLSPWFVHSVHGSLQSALAKVKTLANHIGHENIKIGKVIPIDQYIEIV